MQHLYVTSAAEPTSLHWSTSVKLGLAKSQVLLWLLFLGRTEGRSGGWGC